MSLTIFFTNCTSYLLHFKTSQSDRAFKTICHRSCIHYDLNFRFLKDSLLNKTIFKITHKLFNKISYKFPIFFQNSLVPLISSIHDHILRRSFIFYILFKKFLMNLYYVIPSFVQGYFINFRFLLIFYLYSYFSKKITDLQKIF